MVTNCFFVSMYDAKTKRWPIPSSKDLKKLQQEAGLLGHHCHHWLSPKTIPKKYEETTGYWCFFHQES